MTASAFNKIASGLREATLRPGGLVTLRARQWRFSGYTFTDGSRFLTRAKGHGKPVSLTWAEYHLLRELCQTGHAESRARIDTTVYRLRKKLGPRVLLLTERTRHRYSLLDVVLLPPEPMECLKKPPAGS